MRAATLIRRGLVFYWRTNLAMVAGVATAVSVLAGALLVGDSVRTSLRELVLTRLGRTDQAIVSSACFREELSHEFVGSCPLLSLEGIVRQQASGRSANRVLVYGVDHRFWSFHGVPGGDLESGQILLSESLARELGSKPGDWLLLRVEKPSAIPAESLHGNRDLTSQTIRLRFGRSVPAKEAGEFSLRPQQGDVRAAFVPLARLQRELGLNARINTILLPSGVESSERILRAKMTLEDVGIRLSSLQLDTEAGLISDSLEKHARSAAASCGFGMAGVFTYLANSIRLGRREIPYSLVTATELAGSPPEGSIILNDWAGRDLDARRGDTVELEYYLWLPDGRLTTESARFRAADIVPMRGLAADRNLTPLYPGITDTRHVSDWDPPFPIDLGRIRPKDEDYWNRYRTTPKVFLSLADGQRLWKSRFGQLSALRLKTPAGAGEAATVEAFRAALREELDPLEMGFSILPVRQQGLEASRGATDFGAYFLYFSFFLMAAAIVLTGLFFRLGVEQRVREIGLLAAVGVPEKRVRRMFVAEGSLIAIGGTLAGAAGAALYASFVLLGLRTWWMGATGTRLLTAHFSPQPLALGMIGGLVTAVFAVVWTLRGLTRLSPRQRLGGILHGEEIPRSVRRAPKLGLVLLAIAALLLVSGGMGLAPPAGSFFAAGTLLLVVFLLALRWWVARRPATIPTSIAALGIRYLSYRPARTVLSVALIGSAMFLIVSVDAFRKEGSIDPYDPASGTAGYPLMAESVLALYHNPATREGKQNLGLEGLDDVEFVPFRLRPGDDVSCLNLYEPRNPRVLGAPGQFLRNVNLAALAEPAANAPASAAVSANSLQYVLHRKIGDQIEFPRGGAIRLAAVLADTVFQRELIVSEENFMRLFAGHTGYRVFLIRAPREKLEKVTAQLEESLADYGFDVVSTADQLAAFHRVENTYLSTFQTLGALGLLLGTAGLAVVLLRNALERRRELALLRAAGYRKYQLGVMILAENILLLILGLASGTATALIAIVPAFLGRGGHLSPGSVLRLVLIVLITGVLSSLAATLAALRAPLLTSLRTE